MIIIMFCTGVIAFLEGAIIEAWPVYFSVDRLVPIYAVATEEKKVAISFDAAWGDQFTPQILQILDKYNIKTTFFLVKFWVEQHPEMTKRIAAAGHEIGNHSATHPHMNTLSKEEIARELSETNELIEKISGQAPRLFRPPFGEYNNTLIEVIEQSGMKAIQWSVDSLDWQNPTSEEISRRVLEMAEPGSIVLFHNNAQNTPPALEPILEGLFDQGYEVVPISELIFWDNYYIESHSGIQRPLKIANETS